MYMVSEINFDGGKCETWLGWWSFSKCAWPIQNENAGRFGASIECSARFVSSNMPHRPEITHASWYGLRFIFSVKIDDCARISFKRFIPIKLINYFFVTSPPLFQPFPIKISIPTIGNDVHNKPHRNSFSHFNSKSPFLRLAPSWTTTQVIS